MPNVYKRNTQEKLSEHFFSTDFDCHCSNADCLETLVDASLITGLEELWKLMGGFLITSGYRCPKHNETLGGAPKSQHLLGRGVDIKSSKSYNALLMKKFAEQVNLFRLGGIGTYIDHLHVDVGPKRRWGK